MTIKLFVQAITKFILGVVLVGLLIFLPAGTFSYTRGWLFMGILFVPMFLAGIVMMFKNPRLLQKRLDAKEEQKEQSMVVKLSGLMFLVGFIIAGFGFRLNWYTLPKGIVIGAAVRRRERAQWDLGRVRQRISLSSKRKTSRSSN